MKMQRALPLVVALLCINAAFAADWIFLETSENMPATWTVVNIAILSPSNANMTAMTIATLIGTDGTNTYSYDALNAGEYLFVTGCMNGTAPLTCGIWGVDLTKSPPTTSTLLTLAASNFMSAGSTDILTFAQGHLIFQAQTGGLFFASIGCAFNGLTGMTFMNTTAAGFVAPNATAVWPLTDHVSLAWAGSSLWIGDLTPGGNGVKQVTDMSTANLFTWWGQGKLLMASGAGMVVFVSTSITASANWNTISAWGILTNGAPLNCSNLMLSQVGTVNALTLTVAANDTLIDIEFPSTGLIIYGLSVGGGLYSYNASGYLTTIAQPRNDAFIPAAGAKLWVVTSGSNITAFWYRTMQNSILVWTPTAGSWANPTTNIYNSSWVGATGVTAVEYGTYVYWLNTAGQISQQWYNMAQNSTPAMMGNFVMGDNVNDISLSPQTMIGDLYWFQDTTSTCDGVDVCNLPPSVPAPAVPATPTAPSAGGSQPTAPAPPANSQATVTITFTLTNVSATVASQIAANINSVTTNSAGSSLIMSLVANYTQYVITTLSSTADKVHVIPCNIYIVEWNQTTWPVPVPAAVITYYANLAGLSSSTICSSASTTTTRFQSQATDYSSIHFNAAVVGPPSANLQSSLTSSASGLATAVAGFGWTLTTIVGSSAGVTVSTVGGSATTYTSPSPPAVPAQPSAPKSPPSSAFTTAPLLVLLCVAQILVLALMF